MCLIALVQTCTFTTQVFMCNLFCGLLLGNWGLTTTYRFKHREEGIVKDVYDGELYQQQFGKQFCL